MENIHDTPATFSQNEEYNRDPGHPKSKPYSKAQLMAHEEASRKVWLYHPKLGEARNNYGRIFDRDEVDDAIAEGWTDHTPLHPKEVEMGKTLNGKSSKKEAESTPLLEAVRKEYKDATGKSADKRWGVERIQEELSGNS